MLHIYADGREIAVPSDISFQYNIENPLVTEAEGYSLSIEVPLDAGDNLSIFGMITRLDADIYKVRYDALLITPQYSASGVLAIVGLTEKTVKLQFLQGRSAQNFNAKLDRTYINELDLGKSPLSHIPGHVTPAQALGSIRSGTVAVALPWVNSSSGEIIHNRLIKNLTLNRLEWHSDTTRLSYMPYLIEIASRICTATGYTHDFSQWEESPKRYLIICNTMPESLEMENFAYPLPHWTAAEFFSNIEFILGGHFDIDSHSMHIKFTLDSRLLQDAGTIEISDVVDTFDTTLEADPDDAQIPEFLRNRGYDDNSGRYWNLRCCDWFIRNVINGAGDTTQSGSPAHTPTATSGGRGTVAPNPGWSYDTIDASSVSYKSILRFDTLDSLLEHADQYRYSKNLPGSGAEDIFYAADVRCFFCLCAAAITGYSSIPADYRSKYNLDSRIIIWYRNILIPVNDFGDYLIDDSDDADRIDLKTVPVDLDIAQGLCCFLPFTEEEYTGADDQIRQLKTFKLIMAGKKDRPQYYDKLYVAYWDGLRENHMETSVYPLTSNVTLYDGWNYEISPQGQDLRLNNGFIYGSGDIISADFRKIYKISFLSEGIPDISGIFHIRGKRYICRKLTADFSSSGMSPLIKGEFYRLS